MCKLSVIDEKIIRRLLRDGRTSYVELAEECGVSKNVVWKRYKAMEKKGIISGATAQINYSRFGFEALATLLISVEAQKLDEVMASIQKITEIHAYRQYNSIFNVRAVTILKDLTELDHVKQVIKRMMPVISLKTYVYTSTKNIPENLSLSIRSKGWAVKEEDREAKDTLNSDFAIDDLDKKIVCKLVMHGRASFTQIAKEIGVATETVVKRYQKLRERGDIKVRIQINPKKIGYSSMLDFNIAFITPFGLLNRVVESLGRIPDVIAINKTSGDFDLQVTAMIRDTLEEFAIQESIARIRGITRVEASARKIPDKWPILPVHINLLD